MAVIRRRTQSRFNERYTIAHFTVLLQYDDIKLHRFSSIPFEFERSYHCSESSHLQPTIF